jgi:hypothetical protein
MSVQLSREGTPARSATSTPTRATLRTRPRIQRIVIRSWDYIPAVRVSALTLRLLAVLTLAVVSMGLLSISNWWGLPLLALALAILLFSIWVFTTSAKGWPPR